MPGYTISLANGFDGEFDRTTIEGDFDTDTGAKAQAMFLYRKDYWAHCTVRRGNKMIGRIERDMYDRPKWYRNGAIA
jgi:hypothetical protein